MKNTTDIGNVGYAKTLCKFVQMNIPVYTPFAEGYKADLIADFGGKLNRIQVKTTERVCDGDQVKWKVTRQDGYHGNRISYDPSEVDYFATYCIENDLLCLLPYDQVPKSELVLRLDSYTGVRTKVMKFASDFTFEKTVENLVKNTI